MTRIITEQPADLVRFIGQLSPLSDGTVPLNLWGDVQLFESELFDCDYTLSVLAQKVLDDIREESIIGVNTPLPEGSLIGKLLNSNLSSFEPNIYTLCRIVVLESFSLVYHINLGIYTLKYASKKDITRSKDNLNYLADYFGTVPEYYSLIDTLRTMYISFGYIENQLNVIMSDLNIR